MLRRVLAPGVRSVGGVCVGLLRRQARAPARLLARALSSDDAPPDFDHAEKAAIFAKFFEQGQPMWQAMSDLAQHNIHRDGPTRILDLGCGPGEPACHFAATFPGVPTIASDVAPSMIELAKQRVAAKGLADTVECQVLDMADLGSLEDATYDLVIGQMSFQFVPDKPDALREAHRVMAPGGLLVANVWVDFDLLPIAGGLVAAAAGPPDAPPPPNPNGPLGLADKALFDGLLRDAGFTLTAEHNHEGAFSALLGALDDEQSFKMAALPVWDTLDELSKGTVPDAWAKAQAAFPDIAQAYTDANGRVNLEGTYRIAVARKE